MFYVMYNLHLWIIDTHRPLFEIETELRSWESALMNQIIHNNGFQFLVFIRLIFSMRLHLCILE